MILNMDSSLFTKYYQNEDLPESGMGGKCLTHGVAEKCKPNFDQKARTYLLTYLLTPWCRVLLEKLAGLQLVKKFPAFYGTRRFITAFTSAPHLSLS